VIHPSDCDCDLYGCQLRRKGVRYSSSATQTMRARRPFRKPSNTSWEAGPTGEHRADGSFMPYLDGAGRKIRVKEMGERRQELTRIRRDQVAGPAPTE